VGYLIPCLYCDNVYIGETGRRLETRLYEHKKNIEGSQDKYTGLTIHRINTNHNFDYNNVKILATETNNKKRN
jgi:hypothetical protein